MADIPESPVSREEMFLAKSAGQDITLPVPITRRELFLAKIAGQNVVTPEPVSREEQYLNYIAEHGSGGDITTEALTVTANGTYIAPSGKAYTPVAVNVPSGADGVLIGYTTPAASVGDVGNTFFQISGPFATGYNVQSDSGWAAGAKDGRYGWEFTVSSEFPIIGLRAKTTTNAPGNLIIGTANGEILQKISGVTFYPDIWHYVLFSEPLILIPGEHYIVYVEVDSICKYTLSVPAFHENVQYVCGRRDYAFPGRTETGIIYQVDIVVSRSEYPKTLIAQFIKTGSGIWEKTLAPVNINYQDEYMPHSGDYSRVYTKSTSSSSAELYINYNGAISYIKYTSGGYENAMIEISYSNFQWHLYANAHLISENDSYAPGDLIMEWGYAESVDILVHVA